MNPGSPVGPRRTFGGIPPPFLRNLPQPISRENILNQVQLTPKLEAFFSPMAGYLINDAAIRTNISFLRFRLAGSPENIRAAIKIDPGVMHGNPVFQGTRVPVYQIIQELADGTGLDELPECFPSLDQAKIQAGLDFTVRLLRIYDD